jgi:hypothetical protein
MEASGQVSITPTQAFTLPGTTGNSPLLTQLFVQASPEFQAVIARSSDFRLQIIYTEIIRNPGQPVQLLHHTFNLDPAQYFYPASLVKLPTVLLTYERLNELKIPELDASALLVIDPLNDCITANDKDYPAGTKNGVALAHYIKDALVLSGNTPYNRLYDFLGPCYIQEKLRQKGYYGQVYQRFLACPDGQVNFQQPKLRLMRGGRALYQQLAATCQITASNLPTGVKAEAGVNVRASNFIPLADLHEMLIYIMLPEAVAPAKRFALKPEQLTQLRKYLSITPPETSTLTFDPGVYNAGRLKYLLYGNTLQALNPNVRIFNKVGLSLGYLTDVAYIVDYEHQRDFFVSATMWTGVPGSTSENYEYFSKGMPFFQQLGQLIWQYEAAKPRQQPQPPLTPYSYARE